MTERRRPNRAAQSAADQRRARRAAAAARQPVRSTDPWWRRPRILIVGAVAIGIAALIALAFASSATGQTHSCEELVPAPIGDPPASGSEQPAFGNAHVRQNSLIEYPLCPPVSGDHYPTPLRPGFYGSSQRAEAGGWVHSLEHGFIVVLYRGELDEPTRGNLQRFIDAFPQTSPAGCPYRKLVVARFDDMTTPFAVAAWQNLLLLPEWDQEKALAFTAQWLENGPSNEARVC